MKTFLIRVFSFFLKEFHDVRRQPLLLLSLVGGPLLVLSVFGLTFESSNPFITTILVWPENGIPGFEQEQAEQFLKSNFYLLSTMTNKEDALKLLDDGMVDVVQIVPDVTADLGDTSKRPEIEVYSRAIDPTIEAWTRSLAYGEVNYINKQLLAYEANQAKEKANEVSTSLKSTREEMDQISQSLDADKLDQAETLVVELRDELEGLIGLLPPAALAQANLGPEVSDLYREIHILIDDLNELEQTLREGNFIEKISRMTQASNEIGDLQGSVDIFIETPSENIVSPVRETYTNLRGGTYSMVIFYAPSVLALLVQQLAITMASLGLVREREMGAFEMFRVSPLRFREILIGKSLAYILYVTIVGLVLTGLLTLIGVPLPVNPGQYILLIILTTTASVGIGCLISALAKTDSQAVQMTMLILLMSIFFTGFFLPITGFRWPAQVISLLLPMSAAIDGLQDFLLVGTNTNFLVWIPLVLIIILSYGVVSLIMRWQYRKVLD